MLRHIFYGAPRTWLRATLVLGLGLGCLWGSLQGVHIAVQQGYVQLSVLTVALNTLQSQLNTTLFAAVFVSFLSSLVFAVCYVVLTMLRFPPRSADVGAGAWMAAILLCPAVGYGINQTHWFPPFWSPAGVVGNALVVSLFLLLGFAAWMYLRRMRDHLDAPLQRLAWVLSLRVIGGFALYWLTINVAFYGVNAYASSLVGAEQPPRLKVVVIGLDAATWKVMDPLLQQGRLPNLRRLMESGTYGPLTTLEPTLSPIIWTTIATGKPMSAHGITHFIVQKEGPDQGTLATS
ncbi:MAG: alkaline phosphatase family protein, partial [Candidatus Entotheonellia bacterium]